MMKAAYLTLGKVYLLAALTGAIAGALSSPLVPLLESIPAGILLFLLFLGFPWLLKSGFTAPRAMRAGMLLGFCFGLGQTLLLFLINRESKIFTGFFIFDRGFVLATYTTLGGILAVFLHCLIQRQALFATLFFLEAVVLELITLHYFWLRHWVLLPARPYALPFAAAVGLILFFLLYRLYYFKMLGIHYPIRRRNQA
ncbi:MAG: hypothetical protein NTV14_02700 [Coprothermobacterota bacterium]|nr:hypothetical protein [Coprothermobacterota bacterium]